LNFIKGAKDQVESELEEKKLAIEELRNSSALKENDLIQ
jgi:hypothetical protein